MFTSRRTHACTTACACEAPYLIAGGAARLEPLGVVPAAVDLALLVEVDEVHEELVTEAAHEAARVPAHAVARPRRKHRYVTSIYLSSALIQGSGRDRGGVG